ncbi:choice-of-anchor I family protein [Paraliomyxa miuraensis]|uniref:choice-of-anchor I family protein n=1 Tax=Paraliomyxa miuraensis TaxID=376150 RepID=UPI002258B021|nr:choice-of-anchor I family protein [Paraliomyxa miuraensis]MCX4245334.1 choice-of-anchor I family protein [Paraliomyxa miuraensis]
MRSRTFTRLLALAAVLTGACDDDSQDPFAPELDALAERRASEVGVEVGGSLEIHRIGRYASGSLVGLFDQGAAEIAAYDPESSTLLVTNGMAKSVDVVDLSDPTSPAFVRAIPFPDRTLGAPTSVAVRDGVVAVAVPSAIITNPGRVSFFDLDGNPLASVTVGALPDMVTFSPDGTTVLTANEGEPSGYGGGHVDPEGSVSLIDVSGGVAGVQQADVTTVGFGALVPGDLDATTRVFGPRASIAKDLEPEFLAVAPDGSTAFVTLQENNAMAIVDLAGAAVTSVVGMGLVDHSVTGLDASDQDGVIEIGAWPVWGMRQPDAIAVFEVGGSTYLVTANEGDAREYDGFDEQVRIADVILDPGAFPDAVHLQQDEHLGRLRVSSSCGDLDGDGDLDELWAFGSRSISIFDASGTLVWDSGAVIEQTVAAVFPEGFNTDNDANDSLDSRSDDKGPEPEGLAVGEAFGSTYVFVGLERVGGFMVWNVDDPLAPVPWGYVNPRDFAGDAALGTAGDLGPEGLVFIAAIDSPTGNPLLVVTHETSGTVSIYELVLA